MTLCNFSAYLHYESGIFHVSVYIDMKTEFKIVVYLIHFLTPGKCPGFCEHNHLLGFLSIFLFFSLKSDHFAICRGLKSVSANSRKVVAKHLSAF